MNAQALLSQQQTRRYFCAHCHDSDDWFLVFSFETIDDVYGHWLSNHTELPTAESFLFYAVELVGCHYCHYSGLYDRLRKHHEEKHSDDPFVVARKINRNQCALCYYTEPNLPNHFQQTHQQVLKAHIFNPVCFTRENLAELLTIDIHQKRRCGYCGETFETDHEIQQHHFYMHLDKEALFYEWRDKDPHEISYLICGRCNRKLDPEQYYRHIEIDQAIFQSSNNRITVNEHINESNHTEYFRLYRDYLKTRVIFGNGMILFKQNLIFSEYDDSQQFAEAVDSLLHSQNGL